MEDLLNGLFLLDCFIIGEQGGHVQQIDHAHRIGFGLGQQGPQQTARCNHVVLVGLLLEIFQSVQGLRALLNLVKNDQRLSRQDLLPSDQGQQLYDPLGILVGLKDGA